MAKEDLAYGAQLAGRLVALGPVEARHMFGGAGLFLDGTMFGLISGGTAYLKAGPETREAFDEAGSEPFAFMRGARRVETSYRSIPDAVLADGSALAEWGERALSVARAKKRGR